MLTTTTTTTKRKTESFFLLPIESQFYVRPGGACDYGEHAGTGFFELVQLGEDGLPYPCGRRFRKTKFGGLEVYAANGRVLDLSRDALNDIADRACRKLMQQGW